MTAVLYTTGSSTRWFTDGLSRRPILESQIQTTIDAGLLPVGSVPKWVPEPVLAAIPVVAIDTDAIKQYVAQQVVAALTGTNGHLIPDGDIDRITESVLDFMSWRLRAPSGPAA